MISNSFPPGSSLSFPQYRRYLNRKNYFCFFSEDEFDEIQAIGSKWILHHHKVKILPDRNFVADLLYSFANIAEEITSQDYDEVYHLAEKN